jgi:hypothetical protein
VTHGQNRGGMNGLHASSRIRNGFASITGRP